MRKNYKLFYLHPTYWLISIVCGLLRLLVWLLPFHQQIKLGKKVGYLLYWIPSKAKRTAATNIKLCFPELSTKQHKLLLKQNFANVGAFIMETALAFWGSEKKLRRIPFTIKNPEILAQALAKGSGVLLAGVHFTTLEIVGRLFSLYHPLAAMYRPSKFQLLENILRPCLVKHYREVIDRGNIRGLYRILAQNLPIWYAVDIDRGEQRSVFVPFFGISTATMTAPARIAARTQAVVLPIAFYRRSDDRGYEGFFNSLPDDYPTGDPIHDAILLNTLLEQHIRHRPEQYFWQYKRFKSRPNGEKRFY